MGIALPMTWGPRRAAEKRFSAKVLRSAYLVDVKVDVDSHRRSATLQREKLLS